MEIPGGYRVNLRRATNISYVGGDAEEISIFFYTEYNERLRIKVKEIKTNFAGKLITDGAGDAPSVSFLWDFVGEFVKNKLFASFRSPTTPIVTKYPWT